MAIKPPVTMPKTDRELFRWLLDAYDLRLKFGAGSPENEVVADRGTLYMRTDGSTNTTLYVKTADDGLATGWTPK
jgi:hypothetical protein